MTDIRTAKKIGARQAYKAITIGLVLAYLIMAGMAGPFWLFKISYSLILIFAGLLLYGFGYLYGGLAGKLILIKKYEAISMGVVIGYLALWSAILISSLFGFFTEGLLYESFGSAFKDYILRPIVMISFWGFIPITGVGILFGYLIKKNGKQHQRGNFTEGA